MKKNAFKNIIKKLENFRLNERENIIILSNDAVKSMIKGGYDTLNATCSGGTNSSCENVVCRGGNDGSCSNGSCQ